MTRLLLSVSASERLRRFSTACDAGESSLIRELTEALSNQPLQLMTGDSAAVPSQGGARLVLDHTILVAVARLKLKTENLPKWKLSSLVTGSEVYVPPKPKFERSKELEDSLAAIRQAQEQAEYEQMSRPGAPITSSAKPFSITSQPFGIPRAYVNIAGTDPSLPLITRIAGQTGTISFKEQRLAEEEEWKNVQRQLSVILNVSLSVVATATAAWWASGTANISTKVLSSLAAAIITALAEIVLYNRYQVYVTESRSFGKKRMTGSDARQSTNAFEPLTLKSSKASS